MSNIIGLGELFLQEQHKCDSALRLEPLEKVLVGLSVGSLSGYKVAAGMRQDCGL